MRELYVPDLRFVDHRLVGWGELEGREAFIEIGHGLGALTSDLGSNRSCWSAARLGYLVRLVYRGRMVDGGGEFEIAALAVSLYRDGLVTHFEIFEGADVAAGDGRFEEIGAATDAERNVARFCLLVNTRDLQGLGRLFAADYASIDHRLLGWDTVRGPAAMIELYRSWFELVPDMEVCAEILAGDDRGAVFLQSGSGHAADGGGEVEYAAIVCSTYRDGLIAGSEIFEADDRAGALARYDELRRDDAAG